MRGTKGYSIMRKQTFLLQALAGMVMITLSLGLTACSSEQTTESSEPAGTGNYTGPSISARFASEEIEGDFMTVWGKKFAEHMKAWSGGRIQIEVFPYGSLGTAGDINELAQMGVVEFVFSDYAWISSYVPQAQVLSLNYLFPADNVPGILDWMHTNGDFVPLLDGAFRKHGLVPMGILYEGWQWITSNEPIRTPEDMDGLKIRLMSSRLLVETYRAYGASPTPMSYGEVYSSLQMGMIDAQVNPLFAAHSMKFFEVQDHFTQLYSEPFLGIPTANQTFFENLPPEVQEEMKRFWRDAIMPASQWIDERNASDRDKMLEQRPSLTFHELSAEHRALFQEKAENVYDVFLRIGGEGAQELLDAIQRDIPAAQQALSNE